MKKKNRPYTKDRFINCVLITDDNYITPTVVAIQSIVNNCNKNNKYNLYVICDNVSDINKNLIKTCSYNVGNVNISLIDSNVDFLLETDDETKDIYMVANKTALLKFKLAEILKSLDKVLYLDGDILVNCDIAEIYKVELYNNYVAAVRDLPQVFLEPQLIGSEISGINYFNSGVMLLNLQKFREDKIKQKLIKLKKEKTDDNLMDQNVFNIAFKNKVVQLDLSYNVCYANYLSTKRLDYSKLKKYYKKDYSSIDKIKEQAKIIHYSSFLKPWIYYDAPFAELWVKAYYLSPLKDKPLHRISLDGQTNISYKKANILLSQKNDEDMHIKKKIIPIVLCPDHNYAKYATVTIQSIIDNITSNQFEYRIYIFHDEEMFLRDKEVLKKLSTNNVKVECLDVRNLIDKTKLYSRAHYSKQMFYRWLIPEVLPQYTKVIYIDCDVVLNDDIVNLYNIPLGDKNIVGAVRNPVQNQKMENYLSSVLKINPSDYVNSGVMVFYTRKFLFQNIKEKCLELLYNHDVFLCPDQDVINIVLKDKIKFLPSGWNLQWENLTLTNYDKYKNTHNIIHFTTGVKPWKLNGVNHSLAEYFWKYARKSPLYEEILYSNIDFAINKLIKSNSTKQETKKKEKKKLIITWPFRTMRLFFKNWKDKNFKYACKENKIKWKYAFNRLFHKVDKDNNSIIKVRKERNKKNKKGKNE